MTNRSIVADLIRKQISETEAAKFARWIQNDETLAAIAGMGRDVLGATLVKPGACAHMTAIWVAGVRDHLTVPAVAVVGHLAIDGQLIFGRPGARIDTPLVGEKMDWDGHCWLAIGDMIGDLSLFRTAYSSRSPALLRETILREFGPGRGAALASAEQWAQNRIEYRPMRVLTDREINGLLGGWEKLYRVSDKS